MTRYLCYKADCKIPSFTRTEGTCSFLCRKLLVSTFKFAASMYPVLISSLVFNTVVHLNFGILKFFAELQKKNSQ